MKNNAPKIEYVDTGFEDSEYSRYNKYTKKYDYWKATTLYSYIKKQKLQPFEIPVASLPLDYLPFTIENLDDFIYQCKRVKNTDLKYPIVLDSLGTIADGYHRLAKALLAGDKTIKAYRLQEMPKPDRTEENK